jgi:hypothetical protein
MTKDDVLRMAREAGASHDGPLFVPDAFTLRFAAMVAAAERAAILQMSADNWYKTQWSYDEAIRQRNKHDTLPRLLLLPPSC